METKADQTTIMIRSAKVTPAIVMRHHNNHCPGYLSLFGMDPRRAQLNDLALEAPVEEGEEREGEEDMGQQEE